MDAEILVDKRIDLSNETFVELVIWRLPRRLRGSAHDFKYRLALISDGVCVLRYDNEDGKGDHRHIGDQQQPYDFVDLTTLLDNFYKDVRVWRAEQ
jgi:hypothetical protein